MRVEHRGKRPQIHESAYVAPNAVICGDVTLGPSSRVLFGAVLAAEGGPVGRLYSPKGRRERRPQGIREVPVVVFRFLFGWAESAPIAVTATSISHRDGHLSSFGDPAAGELP